MFTVRSLDISGAVGDRACAPNCGRAFRPSAGIVVTDIRCHDNDSICIGGGGGPTTVEGSEIDHNGLDQGFWGVEAGGIKRLTGAVTIRNNHIHDNGGNGVHWDKCEGALFLVENNVIEGNGRKGVSYEISGGFDTADRAIIRNNTIRDNGWESREAPVACTSSHRRTSRSTGTRSVVTTGERVSMSTTTIVSWW